MGNPRGHQQILEGIESRLRESDPGLVASFAALATNPPRPAAGRVARAWGGRIRGRWSRRWPRGSSGRVQLLMLIPVIVLAVLSLLILIVPGSPQRHCGQAHSVSGPHQVTRCVPGSKPVTRR